MHSSGKNVSGGSDGVSIVLYTVAEPEGPRMRRVEHLELLAALKDKKSRSAPQSSPLLRSGAEVNADNQSIEQMESLVAVGTGIQASIDALRQFQAETIANQLDSRVQTTLFELRQLASYLSGFPGRKNVVWFSGAFPISIFRRPFVDGPGCDAAPVRRRAFAGPPTL